MSTMKKIWGVIKIAVGAQRWAGKTLQLELREGLGRLYRLGSFCLRQMRSLRTFLVGKAA